MKTNFSRKCQMGGVVNFTQSLDLASGHWTIVMFRIRLCLSLPKKPIISSSIKQTHSQQIEVNVILVAPSTFMPTNLGTNARSGPGGPRPPLLPHADRTISPVEAAASSVAATIQEKRLCFPFTNGNLPPERTI